MKVLQSVLIQLLSSSAVRFPVESKQLKIQLNNCDAILRYQFVSGKFKGCLVLEILMDKNLLHLSLTKFNKLNKRKRHMFLINQFTFALLLYFALLTLAFIFSLSLAGHLIYTCFRTIYFDSKSK